MGVNVIIGSTLLMNDKSYSANIEVRQHSSNKSPHGEVKAEKILPGENTGVIASFLEEATGVWRGSETASGLCHETGNALCQYYYMLQRFMRL